MKKVISSFVLCYLMMMPLLVAQETFGPYTSDANTVLLLHFDGDLSDASSTGAVAEAVGGVSFSNDARFGQSVYLDNSAIFPNYDSLRTVYGDATIEGNFDPATESGIVFRRDSAYYAGATPKFPDGSYIRILPNSALDLSGDWTIEFWIKPVDGQPANSKSGFSKQGDVIRKTGPNGNNYYVRYLNTNWYSEGHRFRAGFTEDNSGFFHWDGQAVTNQDVWLPGPPIDVASFTDGVAAPSEDRYDWLHVTYQRDASNHWHALAMYDADGNVVNYKGEKMPQDIEGRSRWRRWQYDPGNSAPVVGGINDTLYIGWGNNATVHAYIDEVRISNVVRPLNNSGPVVQPINDTYYSSTRNGPNGNPRTALMKAETEHGRSFFRYNWNDWKSPTFQNAGGDRIINQYHDQTSYDIKVEAYVPGRPGAITGGTVHYHVRNYPIEQRLPLATTPWQTVPLIAQGDGLTWIGSIPQQPVRSVIEYWITVSADGITDTLGIKHERFHRNYVWNGGFNTVAGFEDTYYRFVVVRRNSLVAHFDFEEPNADLTPKDLSEWNMQGLLDGSAITYPEVDALDIGPGFPDTSFTSLRLDGNIVPTFLDFRDSDQMKTRSYTVTHWVKIDTFGNNGWGPVFVHNGARWNHQQQFWNERDRDQTHWWENQGSTLIFNNDNRRIEHYSHAQGEWPNPFEGATINNNDNLWARNGVFTDAGEWLNAEGNWYKVIHAARWADQPNLNDPRPIPFAKDQVFDDGDLSGDFYVQQIVDSDGNRVWYRAIPMRVPPSDVEGPFRLGHRGNDDEQPFWIGEIDELKVWNYFRGPSEDPELWAFNQDFATALEPVNDGLIPKVFALEQNYPNPFNPETKIEFSIPKVQKVELFVHDILGRRVKTLVSRTLAPGKYSFTWDGTNLADQQVASGMYFYTLKGKESVLTRKMLLLK